MSGLSYLLTVTALPSAGAGQAIQNAWRAISGSATGPVVHGFKVVGENRLLAAIDGHASDAERVLERLNDVCGQAVTVKCTPVYGYHLFAKHALQVDPNACVPSKPMPREGRHIIYVDFEVGSTGYTTDQFLDFWKQEAIAVLGGLAQGAFDGLIYKVLVEQKLASFFSVPDAITFDAGAFQLPIKQLLNGNIKATCNEVIMLNPDSSKI